MMEHIEIKAIGQNIDIETDLKAEKPLSTSGFLENQVKAVINEIKDRRDD